VQPLLAFRRLADFAGNAGINEWQGRRHGCNIGSTQRTSNGQQPSMTIVDRPLTECYDADGERPGCDKRISAGKLTDASRCQRGQLAAPHRG
jgi:hypothetical protein